MVEGFQQVLKNEIEKKQPTQEARGLRLSLPSFNFYTVQLFPIILTLQYNDLIFVICSAARLAQILFISFFCTDGKGDYGHGCFCP
jgi:hypothetical protein